jgi:hypothetical protein
MPLRDAAVEVDCDLSPTGKHWIGVAVRYKNPPYKESQVIEASVAWMICECSGSRRAVDSAQRLGARSCRQSIDALRAAFSGGGTVFLNTGINQALRELSVATGSLIWEALFETAKRKREIRWLARSKVAA